MISEFCGCGPRRHRCLDTRPAERVLFEAVRSRLRSLGRGDRTIVAAPPQPQRWAMDDFSSNLTTFTPDYDTLRNAARQINPDLRFFPVLYHDDYG